MTLNTKVRILGPVDPQELFEHFVHLMGHDLQGSTAERQHPDKFQATYDRIDQPDGEVRFMTTVGQGLPAWFCLHGRYDAVGESMAYREVEEVEVEEVPGYDDYVTVNHACWISIWFDTSYNYRDADGLNAGAYHAKLLIDLAPWLSERGADWEWVNEYTSDMYNKLDGIATLVTGGDAADAWFRNFALPAINNEIQASRLRELEAGGS